MSNAWLFIDILSLLYMLFSTSCSSSTLTLEVLFLCEVLWYFMAEPDKTRFPFAGVLVRVLQRSRTNRTHTCVHACVYAQVYYKELVQTIMEAEVIRSAVSKLETQGNWCSSCPNLKAWEPETLMVGSQSKNWQVWHPKRADVSVLVQKQEKTDTAAQGQSERKSSLSITGVSRLFSSTQAFSWLVEAHPHEGGPTVFLNLLTQMWISFSTPLTDAHTQNHVWPNVWHSLVQSSWHIKLTITAGEIHYKI